MSDLLLVAGEASGDGHGAELLAELRRRHPDLACFGLGGDELQAEGLESLGHSAEVAVVGLFEALKVLGRAREIFARIVEEVERRGTRVAVLIDFPEFNLRLARRLSELGVRVVYYISPQLWAWRRGRVRTIARTVEELMVLFPFEADFYAAHGVKATHVGHPLVERVPRLEQVWDRAPEGPAGGPYRVSLLPGSRSSEVERLLPTLCAAARELRRELPVELRLMRASTVDRRLIERLLAPWELEIEVVEGGRFAAIADSHLALCASGTATLEVGLLGTPMIVVYRVNRWTAFFARFLVDLPYYSLANLVLQERVVPELLQDAGHPEAIAAEARRLLTDRAGLATMRRRLADLRPRLGEPGASGRAADIVARYLAEEAAAA